MNLISRLLIGLGLLLTSKKGRYNFIMSFIEDIKKENMNEKAIDIGKDMADIKQTEALLKYINSISERLRG